ncbi:MAG: AAA family ATPase [Myxococcota bacterium]
MSDREGQGGEPFGETTDPAVYVARPASEAALETASRAVAERRIPALVGPPGIGKTLLLHRLADRLAARSRWKPVHLAYASLGADELCSWVLGLLGHTSGPSPRESLLARAKAEAVQGCAVLVTVDEASGLSRETGDCLASLCWQSGGGLAAALAATDDARASRALAGLGPDLEPIRYTAPLSALETRDYVAGRLAQRGASEALRARFDAVAVEWIHRLSGGLPRRIHEVAALLVEAPPDQVTPAWWKDCGGALEAASDGLGLAGEVAPARHPSPVEILDEPELWVGEDEELDDLELELD